MALSAPGTGGRGRLGITGKAGSIRKDLSLIGG